jgi:hypothetical protein
MAAVSRDDFSIPCEHAFSLSVAMRARRKKDPPPHHFPCTLLIEADRGRLVVRYTWEDSFIIPFRALTGMEAMKKSLALNTKDPVNNRFFHHFRMDTAERAKRVAAFLRTTINDRRASARRRMVAARETRQNSVARPEVPAEPHTGPPPTESAPEPRAAEAPSPTPPTTTALPRLAPPPPSGRARPRPPSLI